MGHAHHPVDSALIVSCVDCVTACVQRLSCWWFFSFCFSPFPLFKKNLISSFQISSFALAELCRPALPTLLHIGDEGLAVPQSRGSLELWRLTCAHWISAWRRHGDPRRTERHDGDSWQRQHRRQATERKKEFSLLYTHTEKSVRGVATAGDALQLYPLAISTE